MSSHSAVTQQKTRLCRREIMLCLVGLALSVASGAVRPVASAAPLPSASPVVLTDYGATLGLANDFLTMVMVKSTGEITSLTVHGIQAIGDGGTRSYWQQAGKGPTTATSITNPSGCVYRVVTQTADLADVAFYFGGSPWFPFQVDHHYVLRRDDHGFYAYLIVSYDPASGTSEYEQHDMVFRANPTLYTVAAVDDDRQTTMPTPQVLGAAPQIYDATYRLPDGSVYTKYQFTAYEAVDRVHGVTGEGHGAWIVQPSSEDVNGGPTHQELTVHQTNTTPVLLRFCQGAHLGAGKVLFGAADAPWQKLCGPWFVYFNTGASRAEMWADAKQKAAENVAAWPFAWLDNALYPLERSEVSGHLFISDGTSPAGAWVILAEPEGGGNPDWQRQGRGYRFWAQTDAQGDFTIPNVRYGAYSVYAIVSGVMDQFRFDGVTIDSPEEDLGTLSWVPATHGQLLWQIGLPDRTAGEFLHGQEFRAWGNWEFFPSDFPGSVSFAVGQDDWRTAWNYVQPNVPSGGGGFVSPPWTIHFNFDRPMPRTAALTVGKAGATGAALRVDFNGTEIFPRTTVTHDSAVGRLGIQGYYEQGTIGVDPALLHQGDNVVTLYQDNIGEVSGIMYDAIRMEIEPFVETSAAHWSIYR